MRDNWLEVYKPSDNYTGVGAVVSYLPPSAKIGGYHGEIIPTKNERRIVIDLLIQEAEKVIIRGMPVGVMYVPGGLDDLDLQWRPSLLALEECRNPMPPMPGNGIIINELLSEWYMPEDPTVRSTYKDAAEQRLDEYSLPYFTIH